MREIGKIIYVAAPKEGESKRTKGKWQSVDFVIETDERYPRKVKFTLFGAERIMKADLAVGKKIEVDAFVEAHEYQGNWYNEVRVWKIIVNGNDILE